MTDTLLVLGNVKKAPPPRLPNQASRAREHLTVDEVEAILKASRMGTQGIRNYTLILLMYRHGLRTAEAINLKWEQIDFKQALIYVYRVKNGQPSTQPLYPRELRELRKLQQKSKDNCYIFMSERGSPLSSRAVRHIIAEAGQKAGINFAVRPHQLRHACGYYLASKGIDTRRIQGYLGHKNIYHTSQYTALSPGAFKNLWND